MPTQIKITVPTDHVDEVVAVLKPKRYAHCIHVLRGDGVATVNLCCDQKYSTRILATVQNLGVGTDFGWIDIVELTSTIPHLKSYRNETRHKKKKYRISDRKSVEEIYQSIDSQVHLTFDFLSLVTSAAIIAAIGLIQDSAAVVVAAMIVSPLMTPILGLTFGALIRDLPLFSVCIRNECIGVLVAFATGFIVGIPCAFTAVETGLDIEWPSSEMSSRGTPTALLGGMLVAIPSGAGVTIALTGGISSTLIGVAISAALLPPVVNSGMNLSYGILKRFAFNNELDGNQAMIISGYSFALFLLNVLLIFCVAMVFFRLKGISYEGVQREWARAKMSRDSSQNAHLGTINQLSIYSTDTLGGIMSESELILESDMSEVASHYVVPSTKRNFREPREFDADSELDLPATERDPLLRR
mmetsp:Transcript_850/g.1993  ORF Transcript_850/g.1993 Transcript_850/m.1993 type:complete len:414 (-) Transcript_850:368-1609(-)